MKLLKVWKNVRLCFQKWEIKHLHESSLSIRTLFLEGCAESSSHNKDYVSQQDKSSVPYWSMLIRVKSLLKHTCRHWWVCVLTKYCWRHLDGDEAVVLGAGLFAANLSTTFRLRKFGMKDGITYPITIEVQPHHPTLQRIKWWRIYWNHYQTCGWTTLAVLSLQQRLLWQALLQLQVFSNLDEPQMPPTKFMHPLADIVRCWTPLSDEGLLVPWTCLLSLTSIPAASSLPLCDASWVLRQMATCP